MKKYNYLVTILLILFLSCSERTNKDATDIASINEEVLAVFNSYVNQVNTKGINGIEFYFSQDERFYWVEDGVIQYPNREALIRAIEAFYPTVKTIDLKVLRTDVEVVDSKNAALYVEYKQDVLLNSGFQFTLDGAMTILVTREDGTWKFLIGHSSIKKPRGGNSPNSSS